MEVKYKSDASDTNMSSFRQSIKQFKAPEIMLSKIDRDQSHSKAKDYANRNIVIDKPLLALRKSKGKFQ